MVRSNGRGSAKGLGDLSQLQSLCFFLQSDVIEPPTTTKSLTGSGTTTGALTLPHSLSAPREDVTKSQQPCLVYDAIFNPKALRLARLDEAFRQVCEFTTNKRDTQRKFSNFRF